MALVQFNRTTTKGLSAMRSEAAAVPSTVKSSSTTLQFLLSCAMRALEGCAGASERSR